MKRPAAYLLVVSAAFGCGGGGGASGGVTTSPSPARGLGSGTGEAWFYRLPASTTYRITRVDSLTMGEGASARPQITGKVAHITARSQGSDRVVLALDSIAATPGRRLSQQSTDSVRGLRWDIALRRNGPVSEVRGSIRTVLAEQLTQAVGLLYIQLPRDGIRPGATWTDSDKSELRLDAFAATEVATRSAKVKPGNTAAGAAALLIDAESELSRTGVAVQGGQELKLQGAGRRVASYRLGPGGWPVHLTARDSLALVVTTPGGQTIPVRWITRILVESDAPRH